LKYAPLRFLPDLRMASIAAPARHGIRRAATVF